MSSRWKMNRIGFVNFWLYDEEEFWFADGKLLLRGQNASGKSITTQSFIPFILDGDRTPSHLDPFGSSDRRMDYYFLGEDEREESTGYLYLEFRKGEEYRTLGIGQRARRGKSMDFWGFVILDGRRIGPEFRLYRETGSAKIPLDKRDLRQALGEGNCFTDSPSEYKKLANQHIFGFRKLEQYDQFIRLLIQVRAPKLSKEFKPTKVYEILNDSLQTLTDEDLRTMVDAMEKMDEIQESLETLKRAFEDVKVIRTEYIRYNQYMLAKKGQAYLDKRQEVERAQREMDAQNQRKQALVEEQQELRRQLQEDQEQESLLRAEREGLLDADLEGMDRKLQEARQQQEEARQREAEWKKKAEGHNSRILAGERQLRELQDTVEARQEQLREQRQELEEQQEILRWEGHPAVLRCLEQEEAEQAAEIGRQVAAYGKQLAECRQVIRRHEEAVRRYDEAAAQLEQLQREQRQQEAQYRQAEEQAEQSQDRWITRLYEAGQQAEAWKPERETLREAERQVRAYRDPADAGPVQELLRRDYERQRLEGMGRAEEARRRWQELEAEWARSREELAAVRRQEELEPERSPLAEASRKALAEAGIPAVPFYKTVEFAPELSGEDCARLEAQLEAAGLLDALVVLPEDLPRVRLQCPEFLDTVIQVGPGRWGEPGKTGAGEQLAGQEQTAGRENPAGFPYLTASPELEPPLARQVERILRCLREGGADAGTAVPADGAAASAGLFPVVLAPDGSFRQGILAGRAGKAGEAEFVGRLARKRRREERIRQLQQQVQEWEQAATGQRQVLEERNRQLEALDREYRQLPDFSELNEALRALREAALRLELLEQSAGEQEQRARAADQERNRCYQSMLQHCRPFPYGRTEAEYAAAEEACRDYGRLWSECRERLGQLARDRESIYMQKERMAGEEQALDDALEEQRHYEAAARAGEARIRQYEEYLNRPEIREKAERLQRLGAELRRLEQECQRRQLQLTRLDERLQLLEQGGPEKKAALQRTIGQETCLRRYFEEELSLKLVMSREGMSLADCARKAQEALRESDRNREAAEMLQALYQVFQRRNGSLASYGANLEDCFGGEPGEAEAEPVPGAIRKRVRMVSVWNGKKVYLEEFYQILKSAIEETQLLIQEKDRELFEDILSQTISQQLTDRIGESRRWVAEMSRLMRDMDTSMGMVFSLEWKPRTAENGEELDVAELEQILLRDRELLTVEDVEKVAAHFRSKIRTEKQALEESGGIINYMDLVRDAMDYRKWFAFQMYYRRGEGPRKLLTNAAFNRFSGGEKAMAMYVPLFAAVNAQYQKAGREDHPRMMALDEAFAGVDDQNIRSMFELVQKLDFDYIMNSQALWGCYRTVPALRIAELIRPKNSSVVTIIRYTWNGRERSLDEQ